MIKFSSGLNPKIINSLKLYVIIKRFLMKIKLTALLIFLSLVFSTDPWGGVSVSTADNLDALTLNPAGLAVKRGDQSGFFIPINEDALPIYFASRGDGFGYSLFYKDMNKVMHRDTK